jgi:hypothetical protein
MALSNVSGSNDLTAVIPKILAQGLLALREFCVMPRLVNTDYSADARQKGATIDVPIPSAVSVIDVAPAAYAPDPGDSAPTVAQIPLNYWREAAFYLTDKDVLQAMGGIIPMQASEAVRAIANDVNAKVFGLYPGIFGCVGTAAKTPFTDAGDISAATNARKVLNNQLAPLNPRRMVLDPDAEAMALGQRAFQDASWRADASGIIEGQIGRKLGFDVFTDQQVPTHAAGTVGGEAGGKTIAKAGTPVAAGVKSVTLTVGSTNGLDLVVGDIISFAGHDQTYAVTEAVSHGAAGDCVVKINPGLKFALAGSEVVTGVADHVVNMAFHRDAIALAVRQLQDAAVTDADRGTMMSAVDPVSQLALRLEVRREHKRLRWSYDILFGVGLVRPELAVRIAG